MRDTDAFKFEINLCQKSKDILKIEKTYNSRDVAFVDNEIDGYEEHKKL